MSKDQPLLFWTAFGVISVITLGLLGWGAVGIAQFTSVQASQIALAERVVKVEVKTAELQGMATDIAVIKSQLANIEEKLGAKKR